MKKIIKVMTFLLLLSVMFTSLVACKPDNGTIPDDPITEPGSISLNKTSASMDLYETLTLTVTLNNVSGDVVWISSDNFKATVNNGIVTSLSEGEVTITASIGELSASCSVTITSSGELPTLTLDKGNSTIQEGQELTLQPILKYKNQNLDAEFTYFSTNESVATVANGKITAVSAGTADIRVTASYLGYQTSKTITIMVTPNITFTLDMDSVLLGTSEVNDYVTSVTVQASVYNGNTYLENPTITWESKDINVVTVTDGVLTATGVGETIITATYTTEKGEEFTIDLNIIVERPIIELDYKTFIEINANSEEKVLLNVDDLSVTGTLVGVADSTDDLSQISFEQNTDGILLSKKDLIAGERKLSLVFENISVVIDAKVVTKVIRTAEELLALQSYSPNVKSFTWSKWSDETTENSYDGYFILGNNIDLGRNYVKTTNHKGSYPARIWDNSAEAAGFNGIFDGCGYTITGGIYDQGGLFGYLWKDGVIKNVAFVDTTINNSSFSCIIGISVWGTIDNVLIHVKENNVPNGEIGVVAMNNGSTFVSNNVIVYDDSLLTPETAGDRSSFVNHAADGVWGTYTNTYVFTNYNVAKGSVEVDCPVDPISLNTTLADAGVNVNAFGSMWVMTEDRARFATYEKPEQEEVDLTGNVLAEYYMDSTETFELTLDQLTGNSVLKVLFVGNEIGFEQDGNKLILDAEQYKAVKQHGLVEIKVYTDRYIYTLNVLNITKVITTAEELLALQSYSPNTKDITWNLWGTVATEVSYDGYFVLGNNIDLRNSKIKVVNGYTRIWDNAIEAPGFNGTLDGRGYTISGGVYSQGGLFGYLWKNGVIKNVAIVNATVDSADCSSIIGVSVWGTLDNVLIHVKENNLPNGEYGLIAQSNGATFNTNNVIIYDESDYSKETVGLRAAFVNHSSDWAAITTTNTYVFTNGNVYKNGDYGTVCSLSPIALNTTLADAGVNVSAFGDIWDMSGDRAKFVSTTKAEPVKLDVPNVVVNELGLASWEAIKNAKGYIYKINDGEEQTTTELSIQLLDGQSITVRAIGDGEIYLNSDFSESLTYTAPSIIAEEVDLTGEAKAEYDMSSSSAYELTLAELEGKEVTKVTLSGVEVEFTQDGTKLTFDSASYKAVKQHGLVEIKVYTETHNYTLNVLNITKVITTAEELLALQSYSPNVKSYTWTQWSDETTENSYDGYFVLGNNINLGTTTVKVIKHNGSYPARIWENADEAAGFNGTFDGRGYTISGGVYSQGGLFGYLWKNGVIKNVAIVNATIDSVNASSIVGVSVWGTLDNVLIHVKENNLPDDEYGIIAQSNGGTFNTNNVIIYDDSNYTKENVGKRAAFVNHSSDWAAITTTNTYVFTNGNIYRNGEYGTVCSLSPIVLNTTLADAGVNVSAFDSLWDMTGDRAKFVSTPVEEPQPEPEAEEVDLTGEAKAEYDMSSSSAYELTLAELEGKEVTKVTLSGVEVEFTQDGTKLTFDSASYKAVKQHGLVEIKVYTETHNYTLNVLNITKVITTAEELLALQSYSPNVKSYTWTQWSDETTENSYDGYFVLGNNINLGTTIVKVIKHSGSYPARIWENADEAAGFNGTFDGRGYTISGGVYSQGGLFGYLWKNGVIKNVAIVNATIDSVNASSIVGVSVWGTLDNVLIHVEENNLPDGEYGVVATNSGASFVTNNVIIYDESPLTKETAGTRSSFVNHAAEWIFGTYTNTYVFTNYYAAQSGWEAACPVDPIELNKTLTEAGVNVGAFGSIWDMTGDRAKFVSTPVEEPQPEPEAEEVDLTGEAKAEYDMSSSSAYELTLAELEGKEVTKVTLSGVEVEFTQDGTKLTFDSASYKAVKQHGLVEIKVYTETHNYTLNVLNITKVITTAEELLALQSYSPNVKSYTWTQWSDETTENSYDGYFVLGNNINLGTTTVKVIKHNGSYPARIWENADEAAGFNGTFDGRGYTISGGVYSQGGLFGYLWKNGVIKNVAIVNATIDSVNASSIVGVSVWGTLDNVLIHVKENNLPDDEYGIIAQSNGGTFNTNNVIIYDDSNYTKENVGKRAAFVNHSSDWAAITTTNTYVFTNGNIYRNGEYGTVCSLSPIVLNTTLADAGVNVSAFGSMWDMTGDRAKFVQE